MDGRRSRHRVYEACAIMSPPPSGCDVIRGQGRGQRGIHLLHAQSHSPLTSLTPLRARHSGVVLGRRVSLSPAQPSPARRDPVTAWTVHQREHVNWHTLLPWESPHTFIHLPHGRARLAEPRARRRVPARPDASTPLDGEIDLVLGGSRNGHGTLSCECRVR